MREQRTGTTGYRENHGGKKVFVAAVSVISALIVLLVAFLCSKNSIFFSLAKKSAEKNEFSKAFLLVEKSGGEKAEMLEKYIRLPYLFIHTCCKWCEQRDIQGMMKLV